MPPNSYVLFGTTPGTVIGWSDSEIDVAVPNLPVSTQAPIVVISDGVEAVWGPGVPASGFSFTVLPGAPAPYITQIVPQVLAYGSTGTLTFYGQNLSGATDVSFGNLPYSFPITIFLPPAVNANGTEVTFQYQAGWATPTSVSAQASLVLGGATSTNALTLYLSTTAPATASILMGTSDITGTTQTVVVGQQISLAGRVNGGNTVLNWWTIPGTIIDQNGYTPGSQPGSPVVTDNIVTFYWVAPGTFQVTYLGSYPGNPSSTAAATFNVVGPTITNPNTMVTWGTPQICQAGGLFEMVLAGPLCTGQGILFSPTIQDPNGYSGSVYWGQVLTNVAFVWQPTPGTGACATPGPALDSGWPYTQNPLPDTSPATRDSPAIPLPLGIGLTSASDGFSAQMYLLWQPNLSASVTVATPVPLGSIQWSWSGTTTFNGNVWTAPTGTPAAGAPPPVFQPGLGYPTWGPVFNVAGCKAPGS